MRTYSVRRLDVAVPWVSDFRQRYEAAVPRVPEEELEALIHREASWEEIIQLIDSVTPHGFMLFMANEAHPVFRRAGDRAVCFWYLMGNHTIAERMYRHDPRAMLYAPLRTVIWQNETGAAWFSVDQPSTHFAGLGSPEVTRVGVELDRKLAALLGFLGTDVPEELLQS
ncbi:DUF302 domain-containing protein [Streptomyces sp. NPDC006602]|uniref:DUF302 domain-containing protein n=1 Tax=Streptomyces sp. NPDC006602 TaxID=3364751 RepID=UPI00369ABBA1